MLLDPEDSVVTSATAAKKFAAENVRFELTHIDSNRNAEPVLEDVHNYLSSLESGAFLDGVSRPFVVPAVN